MTETYDAPPPADPPAAAPLAIRVLRGTTGQRVPRATVVFTRDGHQDEFVQADNDGNVEPLVLDPGVVDVVVMQDGFRPRRETLTLPLAESELDNGLKIIRLMHLTQDVSQSMGKTLCLFLLLGLIGLGVLHWILHKKYPEPAPVAPGLLSQTVDVQAAWTDPASDTWEENLAEPLKALEESLNKADETTAIAPQIQTAMKQVTALQAILTKASDQSKKVGELRDRLTTVLNKTDRMKEEFDALDKAEEPERVTELQQLYQQAEADRARIQQETDDAETQLDGVRGAAWQALGQVAVATADVATAEAKHPTTSSQYLWSTGVWRYFEVLFWAMAGILVRLIFTVSNYVRWNRFYRSGLYQHLALLVVSPLLAVVFVLLLSIIRVDSEVFSLDLSDPHILAGVAFLLASTPWKLWARIQGVGDRVIPEGPSTETPAPPPPAQPVPQAPAQVPAAPPDVDVTE